MTNVHGDTSMRPGVRVGQGCAKVLTISIVEKHYRSRSMLERDKIFIQTFGVGSTAGSRNRDRVIVVYLRYLSDLSPLHQRYWSTFLIKRKCVVNYDYHQNTMGHWTDHGSIYFAFLEELRHINEMTKLMGKPALFKKTFADERPREFSSFFRPRKKNYRSFILLLDKMLSENLNRKFFESFQISLKDSENKDRGTISVLEEFLKTKFIPKEKDGIELVITNLKNVRKLRQKPGHKIEDDEYSRRYFNLQDKLIREAYEAVRFIRLIFANHPKVKGYEIDEWLFKGMIRIY